jgi:hypothetical protein
MFLALHGKWTKSCHLVLQRLPGKWSQWSPKKIWEIAQSAPNAIGTNFSIRKNCILYFYLALLISYLARFCNFKNISTAWTDILQLALHGSRVHSSSWWKYAKTPWTNQTRNLVPDF